MERVGTEVSSTCVGEALVEGHDVTTDLVSRSTECSSTTGHVRPPEDRRPQLPPLNLSKIKQDSFDSTHSGKNRKAVRVAVYLHEESPLKILVPDGIEVRACVLQRLVFEQLNIPLENWWLFAIWVCSPGLELQLMDDHCPAVICKQWPELTQSFLEESEGNIYREPVLYLRRNSFALLEHERLVDHPSVLEALFKEAKYNVLENRYQIHSPDAEELGGLLAYCMNGPYNPAVHSSGYFRKTLCSLLPASLTSANFSVLKASHFEASLIRAYRNVSSSAKDAETCRRRFLEICWKQPSYGSAFFPGCISRPILSWVSFKEMNFSRHTSVLVGINRQGVTIIRNQGKSIPLFMPYAHLSWTCSTGQDGGYLSLIIEFDAEMEDGKTCTKELEVFSKQSSLMDQLIGSCMDYTTRSGVPRSDVSTEGVVGGADEALTEHDPNRPKKSRAFSLTRSLSRSFRRARQMGRS